MLTRRTLLAAALAGPDRSIRRELFIPSPGEGTVSLASAYYTRTRGGEMVSIESRMRRSDTVESVYWRRSADHGRHWSEPVAERITEKRAGGTWRRAPRGVFPDPSGALIEFWNEATLPSDDPLEGLRQWVIGSAVSLDGGRTRKSSRQLIHAGAEYSPQHPLPGVWVGKNSYMIGDMTCTPLWLPDGSILLPGVIAPLAPDGSLYNPAGGYTYHDAAFFCAHWKKGELVWELRGRIPGEPARSTRGLDEPTLALLKDGTLIAVMRGSNDRNPVLPSRRWISFSKDQGRTFTRPEPWTFTDGETFYSPASCSQLLQHSSGRLFWLGNITPENPRGNRPRYPFVIGEVDRASGLLQRATLRTVDDLQPGEDPILTLSNFYAREDRETGEIALNMTRLFTSNQKPWRGDAYLYRIPV